MKISVTHSISIAHTLPGTQLHGHTYRVTAIVRGSVSDNGYVITFQELRQALQTACGPIDHNRLEVFMGSPATAERVAVQLARSLSKHFNRLVDVRIAVGDDGAVETRMTERDGEYFDSGL